MVNLCQYVKAVIFGFASETQALPNEIPSKESAGCEETRIDNKFSHFENFCQSGLSHLGIEHSHDVNLEGIWKEAEPFAVCQIQFLLLFRTIIIIMLIGRRSDFYFV